MSKTSGALGTMMSFVLLIGGGSIGVGWSLNSLVRVIVIGASLSALIQLGFSLGLLAVVALLTMRFLYCLELSGGSLKRRIRIFERGLVRDESH